MKGKKKGIVFGILVLLVAVGAGCILLSRPKEKEEKKVRTTQTKESRKSEEYMETFILMETLDVRETDQGSLELSASVKLPDYSSYFEKYESEAAEEGGDEAAFEKKLFALTAEAVKADAAETADFQASYIVREIVVDLLALDDSKCAADWTKKELEAAAKQKAFEAEMEEFALDIMGNFLSGISNWEAVLSDEEKEEAQ